MFTETRVKDRFKVLWNRTNCCASFSFEREILGSRVHHFCEFVMFISGDKISISALINMDGIFAMCHIKLEPLQDSSTLAKCEIHDAKFAKPWPLDGSMFNFGIVEMRVLRFWMRESDRKKLFGLDLVEPGSMLGVMTLAVYTILQSIFEMSAHTRIASTHSSMTTSMVSNIVLWPTKPTSTLPTNSKTLKTTRINLLLIWMFAI
ncbi:unnamed protein product [Caenorhabditis angaria]|uniref:Uncharacterized protein n=1 Tax=Caenorhabditis angaria TaxID=860376 RepID=A0A9P1N1F7_9PELO|nr:unnamed protein product [Caenorhabditis angaria]